MERIENESPQLRKFTKGDMDYDIFSKFAIKTFRTCSSVVD
jgi:hypothetical protein